MKKVTFRVTWADIEGGLRCLADACPIARGFARQLADGIRALVHVDETRFYSGNGWGDLVATVPTPEPMARFAADFDQMVEVKPTRFTIEVPEEVVR